MKLEEFLSEAWKNYSRLTPDAPVIHDLLSARGETILNDHIAFRTFNTPGVSRMELGHVFENWGYVRANDELDFPDKRLKASYWIHPDAKFPKVFISELMTEKFSTDAPELEAWVKDLGAKAASRTKKITGDFFLKPSWDAVPFSEYERFYPKSEYAAWTAAFGIQLNHFTVNVNALKTFKSLQELNTFLLEQGLQLNEAGGVIKGTPAELLEQTSTMAKRIPWTFQGGATHSVMGCYYEFAKRYPLPSKTELFQGFIPKSADKIFESTFEKKK